jgi:signal transduction histidine kinase
LGEEAHFDQQKSIILFRMYQEIMNNIMKHSKAGHVIVSVSYSPDHKFVMTIEDNGVGFDMEQKLGKVSSSHGLGLKNMKNRARLIGAEISIQSKPEKGTIVSVEMAVS